MCLCWLAIAFMTHMACHSFLTQSFQENTDFICTSGKSFLWNEGGYRAVTSWKRKRTRCLHQDTKSLITPSLHLCFALTCCLFVCIRQSKHHNILTSNCLHENVCCGLGRNKDVGMGKYERVSAGTVSPWRAPRSTVGINGERKTITWCPCTPPSTMETFGEKKAPRLVPVRR